MLTPLVEQAADPSNPAEAVALAQRLNELYPHLYIELAYHGQPREKLVNRGLVAEVVDGAVRTWRLISDTTANPA